MNTIGILMIITTFYAIKTTAQVSSCHKVGFFGTYTDNNDNPFVFASYYTVTPKSTTEAKFFTALPIKQPPHAYTSITSKDISTGDSVTFKINTDTQTATSCTISGIKGTLGTPDVFPLKVGIKTVYVYPSYACIIKSKSCYYPTPSKTPISKSPIGLYGYCNGITKNGDDLTYQFVRTFTSATQFQSKSNGHETEIYTLNANPVTLGDTSGPLVSFSQTYGYPTKCTLKQSKHLIKSALIGTLSYNFGYTHGGIDLSCVASYACVYAGDAGKLSDEECDAFIDWVNPVPSLHINTLAQCQAYKYCKCFKCWLTCTPECVLKTCIANVPKAGLFNGNGGGINMICPANFNENNVNQNLQFNCYTTNEIGPPTKSTNAIYQTPVWGNARCTIVADNSPTCALKCTSC